MTRWEVSSSYSLPSKIDWEKKRRRGRRTPTKREKGRTQGRKKVLPFFVFVCGKQVTNKYGRNSRDNRVSHGVLVFFPVGNNKRRWEKMGHPIRRETGVGRVGLKMIIFYWFPVGLDEGGWTGSSGNSLLSCRLFFYLAFCFHHTFFFGSLCLHVYHSDWSSTWGVGKGVIYKKMRISWEDERYKQAWLYRITSRATSNEPGWCQLEPFGSRLSLSSFIFFSFSFRRFRYQIDKTIFQLLEWKSAHLFILLALVDTDLICRITWEQSKSALYCFCSPDQLCTVQQWVCVKWVRNGRGSLTPLPFPYHPFVGRVACMSPTCQKKRIW